MMKSGALKVTDEILDAGKDIINLVWEMIKYFKDILIYKTTNKLNLYNEKELQQIAELAKDVSKEKLLNIIYELSELENQMKWSSQKIIFFQTIIIKLCMKKNEIIQKEENNTVELTEPNGQKKPEDIEKIKKDNSQKNLTKSIEENPKKKNATPYPTMKVGVGSQEDSVWKEVLNEIKEQGKLSLYTGLSNSRVKFESDLVWNIMIPEKMKLIAEKVLMDNSNKKFVQDLVSKMNKKEMVIKYSIEKSGNDTSKKADNNTFGLNINIIE